MIGVSNHLRNASIWVPVPFSEGDWIPRAYRKLVIRHVITTVDGSEIQRSPPDMHESLKTMPYLPYQLVPVQDFFHQQ